MGRKNDGKLFAMRDLCPHRGIPLSAGWFDGETVTGLVDRAKKYIQMIYVLESALGMRIGEVLGLEIDKHFADDFSTVLVRQKVRKCEMEDYLKTDNAYRDIDLHSSVVKMLKEFIGLPQGTLSICKRTEYTAISGLRL